MQRKNPRSPVVIGEIFGASLVNAANTYTGLSYRNSPITPGKVQIYHATNVHGLTQSPAAGNDCYVSWSGNSAATGFSTILSVDSTTEITINLDYADGLGTPTLSLGNTGVTIPQTITVPPLQPNSRLTIEAWTNLVASTNTKVVQIILGATPTNLVNTFSSTATAFNSRLRIANLNSKSKQRSTGVSGAGATAGTGVLMYEDTSSSKILSVRIIPPIPNEPISLEEMIVFLT